MTARGPRAGVARLAVAAALLGGPAAVATVAPAPAASAHSVLVSSNPADGATLTQSPATVTLTFNEDIQPQFATVTVVDSDRRNHVTGDAHVAGPDLSAEVGTLGPGHYTMGYRVTSADGHVVQGSRTFSVAGPDGVVPGAAPGSAPSSASAQSGSAPASATASPAAAPGSSSGSGPSLGVVLGLGAGVAVVLIGGAWAIARRGRSRS